MAAHKKGQLNKKKHVPMAKKKKKIKPKMSYAQLLIDLTNKNSEEEE